MEDQRQAAPENGTQGAPGQRRTRTARVRSWTLVALLVFGAVTNFWAYRDYVFEDAYITYCYAQNLAAGQGFVFNPGERVLGTSTPAYTMLLAILALGGAPIPMAAGAIFALSLSLVGWYGATLLRRFAAPDLGLVFALVTVWGSGRWPVLWGMETPLYLAVLLAALLAALDGRQVWTGVLIGIGFLIRYDGALFALCLLGLLAARRRALPVKTGAAAAALALPWLGFSQLYFGSVFPNTLGAKMATVSALGYLKTALMLQVKGLFSPFHGCMGIGGVSTVLAFALAVVLALPVAISGWSLLRREPLLWQLLLFPLLLVLGYSVIGPPANHFWHLLPGVYLALVLSLLAWSRLLRRFRLEPWAGVAAVVLALLLGAALPVASVREERLLTDNEFYRGRVDAYTRIGEWVLEHDLADLEVMMREPGYFRFITGCTMVDAAGLVTTGIRYHGPKSQTTDVNRIVEEHRPDLIVSPATGWHGLDLSRFLPLYHAIPERTLYIRRSTFSERFDSLAEAWLRQQRGSQGSGPLPRCGFRPHELRPWTTGGRMWGGVTRTRLKNAGSVDFSTLDSGALRPPFLSTEGKSPRWGTITSPEFVIDFDEISFVFAASAQETTQARLLVDGQAVLAAAGTGEPVPKARQVRWPVAPWRGATATIQFCDFDLSGTQFLVADELRTWRYRGTGPGDDFESGRYDERWQTTFGAAPTRLEELACQRGLAFLVGRFAATSRGMSGAHEMRTVPFVLGQPRLSMLVFDFGGGNTRVEVRTGGRTARVWTGTRSRRLQPLVWDLADLVGREIVIAVVDEAPAPEEWIGIDALRLHALSD